MHKLDDSWVYVCFLFSLFQRTSITSMSSSTSHHTRSVCRYAEPLRPCSFHDTLTSSVIRHGRIYSQSYSEALVRLLSFSCVLVCVCFSNQSFSAHLVSSHPVGSRLTMKDWHGISPPVDAAMVGRVTLAPKPTSAPPRRRWSNRKRKHSRSRKQRRRQSRFVYFYDLWSYDDLFDDDVYTDGRATQQQQQSTPVQNVYFFKKGMRTGLHFFKVKALFNNIYLRQIFAYFFFFP